jgi:hypothetical protein
LFTLFHAQHTSIALPASPELRAILKALGEGFRRSVDHPDGDMFAEFVNAFTEDDGFPEGVYQISCR